MKTTELVARNAAVKKKRSEDLAEKMAAAKFLKKKNDLYSKIERDMLNADIPELNERLLAIDAQNYAELADVKWLFNNGNWREESEMESLEKVVAFHSENTGLSVEEIDEISTGNAQKSFASGCLIGASILCLIWTLLMNSEDEGIMFYTSVGMVIGFVPFLVFLGGGSLAIGLPIGNFIDECFGSKEIYSILKIQRDLERDGVNFEDCSTKNILEPFLEIEELPSENKMKSLRSIPCWLVLLFVAVFLFSIITMVTNHPFIKEAMQGR